MSKILVYNIRKEKYAHSLVASGAANRWNKNEEFIIYSGSSRALSVLELAVHRASIKIDDTFKLLVIELNLNANDLEEINLNDLPKNWRLLAAYPELQKIGSKWYKDKKKLILKVPSVIVPKEFNFLINTKHPDFDKKVKIKEIEDFSWDERLI